MLAASRPASYPYAGRNLLEQPEQYMYSECFSAGFFREYLASRQSFLEELSGRQEGPRAWERLADELPEQSGGWWDALDRAPAIETGDVLRSALGAAVRRRAAEEGRAATWVARFAARFEITRRIYPRYTPEMKPFGGEFTALSNYALLSVNAALYYERTGRWPLLNAALKLNDLLASCRGALSDPGDVVLAGTAISKELELVGRLAGLHGVPS
jgi:hypothetical protein